jgi:gag-polypeptide of LTR copia-type
MREFRQYEVAKEMWLALKQKFGGTFVTKLRQLTIKFDTYKKRSNHSMRQHLWEMSNMISELKDTDHILTDEQQVQAVIRSLPYTWEHMKVHLTHNEGIKTLNDAVRHLELEEDRVPIKGIGTYKLDMRDGRTLLLYLLLFFLDLDLL